MWIDAPVLNFNDFPGRIGDAECEKTWETEFPNAYPDLKRYQLLNFPHHPLCHVETLIENRSPILLVYGKEDATVLYPENGQLLVDAMEGTGLVKVIEVKGRGHHPHGKLDDNAEIVNWILEHC